MVYILDSCHVLVVIFYLVGSLSHHILSQLSYSLILLTLLQKSLRHRIPRQIHYPPGYLIQLMLQSRRLIMLIMHHTVLHLLINLILLLLINLLLLMNILLRLNLLSNSQASLILQLILKLLKLRIRIIVTKTNTSRSKLINLSTGWVNTNILH